MLNRKVDLGIAFAYFLVGIGYILIFRVFLFDHLLQAAIKTIPIWILLALACWRLPGTKVGVFLCIGIFFGSIGDYVLAVPGLEKGFMIGLGLFFVAHLFYTFAFIGLFKFQIKRLLLVVMVLIAMSALLIFLLPKLPASLRIPIWGYVFIILSMNITAIFRRPTFPAVYMGAIIFMISDSIIALRKFGSLDIWEPWVMTSYYVAQFLIIYGSIADVEIEMINET